MKRIIFRDYEELSVKTAEMIAEIIRKKPDALLCFPAGETSIGTFNHLVYLCNSGKISFKECRIVGLDEWAHLGKMRSENCFSFLRKHLFNHIDYREENLCFFDGESDDLPEECRRTDGFIEQHGPVDMMLLGAGMNGHLGLNEPGTSFARYSHVVELDKTTREVGQKYFTGEANLTKGITLGANHILESVVVLLQISGLKKAPVVKKLEESEVTPSFPASLVKDHPDSYLLIDADAASLL